jgi:peptide/nickel transport system substrate-binding protein
MKHLHAVATAIALLALIAGCAPASRPSERQQPARQDATTPRAPKSLTIAIQGEPSHLVFDFASTGFASIGSGDLVLAVHQGLVTYDDRGEPHPTLATAVPSRDQGTWTVRPDGTMLTTYRIRPGITWHDGRPLTARDFKLGWEIYTDPEMPISGSGSVKGLLDRVETPDDLTLNLEWAKTYPFAHTLGISALPAIPAHIVEETYRADKSRVPELSYWLREFVGVGPYQLASWEPGSHLVLKAYDAYFGGRAKIDTITAQFIPNQPTIVANLLAGSVDGVINRALEFEQAMLVKDEWERGGRKPLVVTQPTHWRMIAVQFNNPRPRQMLDVRVRRALLHAIDRQAVIDAMLDGQSPVSHSFVTPDDPRWSSIQDVMAKYDYDPRRAQELLAEVGWRTTVDGGTLIDATGARVELIYETSPPLQRTATITAPYLRAIGLGIEELVLSPADARDVKRVISFPAIMPTNIPLTWEQNLGRLYGPRCPSEGNRYTGFNSGCYQNPEHDATIDRLFTEIDPTAQRQLWRDLVKIESEDLPVLPVFFLIVATIFREGVTGVKGDSNPRSGATWNVAEWDVRT